MIDRLTIEKILDAAQIVDVIQEFVPLKKRGANYLGLCPFHNEKTPSFTVSPTKEIFKCFGCGKVGNAVNFIMELEHLTYPEALMSRLSKRNLLLKRLRSRMNVRAFWYYRHMHHGSSLKTSSQAMRE
jgi:DNA primase